MASMFEWVNFNRPDVVFLKGPTTDGTYIWDTSLPDQEGIRQIIQNYNSSWISPAKVPQSVTNRQMKEALTIISYQTNNPSLHPDNILLFLKSQPTSLSRDIAIQNWDYSNDFVRSNPLVNQMAPSLGLTSEDVDNLFILASTRGF